MCAAEQTGYDTMALPGGGRRAVSTQLGAVVRIGPYDPTRSVWDVYLLYPPAIKWHGEKPPLPTRTAAPHRCRGSLRASVPVAREEALTDRLDASYRDALTRFSSLAIARISHDPPLSTEKVAKKRRKNALRPVKTIVPPGRFELPAYRLGGGCSIP